MYSNEESSTKKGQVGAIERRMWPDGGNSIIPQRAIILRRAYKEKKKGKDKDMNTQVKIDNVIGY